jgi:hypothetical protein
VCRLAGHLRRVAARLMIEVVRPGTPLCPRLGVEYPVFCAGTGAAAGPGLVAAGGLRVLGAGGAWPGGDRGVGVTIWEGQ